MSDTPSEGALNIDQAVGLLGAEPPEREEASESASEPVEAPPAEAQSEAQPEVQPEPQGDQEEAEAHQEAEAPADEPEEQLDPIDPPTFWTAEDKAEFAELPRAQQEKVLAYEKKREVASAHAMQMAADARKTAEAEVAQVAQLIERVNDVTARAEAHFDRPVEGLVDGDGRPMRWSDVEWADWFRHDPQAAAVGRAQFEFEQAELQRVKSVQQEAAQTAQKAALTAHVQQQTQVLSTVAPELANDPAKRQAIGAYLTQAGYSPERLLWAEAPDLVIAHKAMLWDQAQSKARTVATGAPQASTQPGAPRRQPAPAPARQVRPTTATTAPSPKRAVDVASDKFRRSGSIDAAVELLTARGSG